MLEVIVKVEEFIVAGSICLEKTIEIVLLSEGTSKVDPLVGVTEDTCGAMGSSILNDQDFFSAIWLPTESFTDAATVAV